MNSSVRASRRPKAMSVLPAGDRITVGRRPHNEARPGRGRTRSSSACKRRGLGVEVQCRRLPWSAVPRATRADIEDAGPQAQAVFGRSGVSVTFLMLGRHPFSIHRRRGSSAMQESSQHCTRSRSTFLALIASWWRREDEAMPAPRHSWRSILPVRRGLGLAVHRRRLLCSVVPRTIRADSDDAGPQAQAVLGDSGVSVAFPTTQSPFLDPPKARRKRQHCPALWFAQMSAVVSFVLAALVTLTYVARGATGSERSARCR
ncbi:uncharacterized protein LOC119448061 isoform X2 [Dermacentor silvarum]|uniref:uncharacterized protein LOC119448061 isoform X2 n=1 Tax=Dermacentor silvarum TaxID=543639 RepID=UPI0021008066|nr:uncharacterized protein LOC119448061 isoform X2 [Dermacentor silvarum]